jgi:hypothetical protein
MYFATMQVYKGGEAKSGHKNVAFINNYSSLSEERHKKISNILSNTETNRNALVPVQFSANLPRKTSTNSTASSTSDVSCRSNPNVSSSEITLYK